MTEHLSTSASEELGSVTARFGQLELLLLLEVRSLVQSEHPAQGSLEEAMASPVVRLNESEAKVSAVSAGWGSGRSAIGSASGPRDIGQSRVC